MFFHNSLIPSHSPPNDVVSGGVKYGGEAAGVRNGVSKICSKSPKLKPPSSDSKSSLVSSAIVNRNRGKLIDQNRALVESPDMVRSQMNFKRLSLTDIKIDIKRVPKKKALVAAMEAADVKESGKSAHGEESSLFRREEPLSMTLTASS
ncbi:60S ribosomal protein L14-2-like [Salvia splendens]|uniref:60S ribosomal protein L14-2-like n=1 Tax=Salvia splendens TaxID=180675 RepID=UPI001C266F94|nr:60S ribosomal protein L14-2-like [Salvia splendens]